MLQKPIPVTLLSGFLGSGKTTLLRHILTSPSTTLRIAVIVNDMAALNIDASLIRKHIVSTASEDEKLIQLQNGCICCTLRGDLLEALVKLAREGQAEYIIIESTGISEPMQVAETFTEEFAGAMRAAIESDGSDSAMQMDGQVEGAEVLKQVAELGGLHNIVKLDTLVTVIDAFNFFENFKTAEFITDRWGKEEVAPEDERTVTDLLVDQIEFANCIIINKVDLVDRETKERIHGVVRQLNPGARIVEAAFSKIDIALVLETSTFDFEKAATGMGWLQSLHEMSKREVNGKIRFAPKPETEEYGISSFLYQARRPFHPERLYRLIHDKFVLMEDAEDAEDVDPQSDNSMEGIDSEDMDSENKSDKSWDDVSGEEGEDLSKEIDPKVAAANKQQSIFRGLLRSKGFIWLATRPNLHGAWSQAGSMLTLQGGENWFCTLDPSEWPEGKATRKSIMADFQEPWGDRRQELVMIGETLKPDELSAALDRCLLTTVEMKRWENLMRSKRSPERIQEKLDNMFEDGFMDWPEPGHQEDDESGHSGHVHKRHA